MIRQFVRFYSQKVAIVGSGPAGFYTALRLLKDPSQKINVDIFEKLPVPYGLSRFGVAPDHPEVKECQTRFEEVAHDKRFNFYGNVDIGKDVSIEMLKDNYNAVIFAYGCSEDNKLNIKGADHKGVISSRQFVGWYNGVFDLQDLNPPLEKARRVVIIGNGNVALDLTRVLLGPVDPLWKSTDITAKAISKLKESKVEHVTIVGRRGLLQSAFTNKELKELIDMHSIGVGFKGVSEDHIAPFAPLAKNLGRVQKRRLDLLTKYFQKVKNSTKTACTKEWELQYLLSPKEIIAKDDQLLSKVVFEHNVLVQPDIDVPVSIEPTGEFTELPADLLIYSTGYKGSAIQGLIEAGIPFNEKKGYIPNKDGRVSPGIYASGWIRRGATGAIASTMMDAFFVAETVLSDLDNSSTEKHGLGHYISKQNKPVVTWQDWEKIQQHESEAGTSLGKTREKLTTIDQVLELIK
ncbi:Oxidoreductase [Komagataella phaffii CBS 7435]|uniref:NADPH:adrenodoxin oxidoreductase, mitochondrial n=1 Tax=Komagataella phaffii (strain ATCC 76273 / CBS 7435 / CECT 11047 / NRRL Y-11430 / Wegner 21-1) TaxID=981350 RepID=F2QXJ8_KOMPC|nr:GQ67_03069T0 [Komagataella phaffii]AOA69195.1 GQ68_03053T0 [Komagataella phaffii GS115]CAH2450296.1 Oxidoreductase [Komagataella phaffii CBS 7435]CCA40126.1 Oxidoreductase [Komagataella phaffii CBS 7435]